MTNDSGTTSDARTPVYVSYPTLDTFLNWIAEMPVTPSRIDRSLWQPKFAGSTGVQLMAGLRFLGLLEADEPTDLLDALARAGKEGRKPKLTQLLRSAYGAELVDDLPKMTPRMLDDGLHALGTSDATHRKALSFFVNAAKSAGIQMPMAIQKRARIRSASPTRRNGQGGRKPKGEQDGEQHDTVTPKPLTDVKTLRTQYIEMLMQKASGSEQLDVDLLDRIEALLGFKEPANA